MKNSFKFSLFALSISLSVAACNSNHSGSSADSVKSDSSTSVKTSSDTTVKIDTAKPANDTSKTKADTVKTVIKKTDVKKTEVKKSNK